MTAFPAFRAAGVIPPVCTPLTEDGAVDAASLGRLVEHLLAAGVDALFVLGSSGETAFLPDEDRVRVVETAVAAAAGRVPVLAGAIDMTTPRVLEQAGRAVKAGAAGIVATAPFYTRTHPAEVERHYRLLADRVDAPLYAYDLPVSVHSKLPADLLLRLAADGVLAGLKDSSGDDNALRDLLVARRDLGLAERFSVLTGSELTVDAALRAGADGVVPGLGNVDPDAYVRLVRHCAAGDWDAAAAEQDRLVRLFRIVAAGDPARMGRNSSAIGAFKAALRLRGVIAHGTTAAPQIPLSDREIETVRALLAEAGLL
jgi:4-hydroxy-tetrahydrodipicolinate synthase